MLMAAAAVLQWQMWGVKIEIFWPSKLKILIVWSFTEKVCQPYLDHYSWTLATFRNHQGIFQKVNARVLHAQILIWLVWILNVRILFAWWWWWFFFFLITEVQFTPYKNIHLKRNNSHLPKATTLFTAKLLKLPTLPAKLLNSVFLIPT